MRILLDECVNPRLKGAFPGHGVKTVAEMGWRGFTNGRLLDVAEGQFDVFLTIDRGLEFQQNLGARRLGVLVVIVRNNKIASFEPIFLSLKEAAERIQPGQVIHVSN